MLDALHITALMSMAYLQALGADPDIYEKLTASLAPSIWQLDDVKKGILCQLFGGTTKVCCCCHDCHTM